MNLELKGIPSWLNLPTVSWKQLSWKRSVVKKQLLDVHGYSTYEDTTIASRMVKDELLYVGGVLKFQITRDSVLPGLSMKQIS